MIHIGTAGWTIPRAYRESFPEAGSGLERYAARFGAAEINSTFYRMHKPETFERWVQAVPEAFRFSVKLAKVITHERRLLDCAAPLAAFVEEVGVLGAKLGPLLIQLPPSLAFDEAVAARFLQDLRAVTQGPVACEPRHASWFEPPANQLLYEMRVARVAADPARVPEAALPGGWPGLTYYRLHGSPRVYYSEYEAAFIADLAARLNGSAAAETWCIFDNTTSGAATGNALSLQEQVSAADSGAR